MLVSLFGSSATTQAAPVLLKSASAAARVEMVGPVERTNPDNNGCCVWLILTETAGLLW
jgi:hypothetical protein